MSRFWGGLSIAILVAALLLATDARATADERPDTSVDLQALGLHEGVINRDGGHNCKFRSPTYRSVGWLDMEHIVVAFNSTPECSSTPGKFTGILKLAILGSNGKLLRSKEISYDSEWVARFSWLKNGGVSVGRDGVVVVEIAAYNSNGQSSKSRLLILSSELSVLQEIDIGRGSLAGLTRDGKSLMVWESDGASRPTVKCRVFTGTPFKETGGCPPGENTQTIPPPEYRKCASRDRSKLDGFEEAVDKKRAVLFGYQSRAFCADLGIFCSTTGKLFVCDADGEKARLQLEIAGDAAAALSPDGTRLGVLQKRRFEVYRIP